MKLVNIHVVRMMAIAKYSTAATILIASFGTYRRGLHLFLSKYTMRQDPKIPTDQSTVMPDWISSPRRPTVTILTYGSSGHIGPFAANTIGARVNAMLDQAIL